MSAIERMTITMPADMAAQVKGAVEGGDYASTSEVIRDAIRDWHSKRLIQRLELEALKAEIHKGLSDVTAGRIVDFDADLISELGRALLARRSLSA